MEIGWQLYAVITMERSRTFFCGTVCPKSSQQNQFLICFAFLGETFTILNLSQYAPLRMVKFTFKCLIFPHMLNKLVATRNLMKFLNVSTTTDIFAV